MVDQVYLLAYPRSGSSIFRLCMAKLTRMKPCQASGGVEAPMLALLPGMEFKGEFLKYHKKIDGPLHMPLHHDDILMHLVRDPLEHLVSWSFSSIHAKHEQIDEKNMPALANELVGGMLPILRDHIHSYRDNITDFEAHEGRKLLIEYERLIADPEYLITKLREFFTVSGEDAKSYRENFGQIKADMMVTKAGTADSIRVNTFGDVHYWRKILNQESINRFNQEFYGTTDP